MSASSETRSVRPGPKLRSNVRPQRTSPTTVVDGACADDMPPAVRHMAMAVIEASVRRIRDMTSLLFSEYRHNVGASGAPSRLSVSACLNARFPCGSSRSAPTPTDWLRPDRPAILLQFLDENGKVSDELSRKSSSAR